MPIATKVNKYHPLRKINKKRGLMITLRQLEFALAVAKHRHFKRAAEDCNISQSALSLGIAELIII